MQRWEGNLAPYAEVDLSLTAVLSCATAKRHAMAEAGVLATVNVSVTWVMSASIAWNVHLAVLLRIASKHASPSLAARRMGAARLMASVCATLDTRARPARRVLPTRLEICAMLCVLMPSTVVAMAPAVERANALALRAILAPLATSAPRVAQEKIRA